MNTDDNVAGLCERTLLQPELQPLHQAVAITLPIKDEKKVTGGLGAAAPGLMPHQNFESLLGSRSSGMMVSQGQW